MSADINRAVFTGRIGKDPELRATANGTSACTFSLAVERPKQKGADRGETDWLDFVAWRGTAEFVSKYLGKGRKVVVECSVRTRKYDDRDGKSHKVVEFLVENIVPADSRPQSDSGSYGGYSASAYQQNNSSNGGGQTAESNDFMPLDDDDEGLPF